MVVQHGLREGRQQAGDEARRAEVALAGAGEGIVVRGEWWPEGAVQCGQRWRRTRCQSGAGREPGRGEGALTRGVWGKAEGGRGVRVMVAVVSARGHGVSDFGFWKKGVGGDQV